MDLTKNKITATLVFLMRGKDEEKEVLLSKKVRKLVVGRFNGFGGSLNKHESIRACAKRELYKESGLVAMKEDLEFSGVVTFHNKREDGSDFHVRVFVFLLKKWRGRLKLKKDEMVDAEWFNTKRLPLKRMPLSDPHWVPFILEGKKVKGEVWHGPKQESLLGLDIKIVKYLSDVD